MKRHVKASIYSAIFFPGAGYFLLSKTKHAVCFLLLTFVALAVVIYDMTFKAQIIVDKILNGDLPIDFAVVHQQLLITTGAFSPSIITATYLFIVVLWVVGIVDCYRVGRLQENIQ
jgi:hypothetical protein